MSDLLARRKIQSQLEVSVGLSILEFSLTIFFSTGRSNLRVMRLTNPDPTSRQDLPIQLR